MPSGLIQSPAMIGKLLLYFSILRWAALPGHLVAAESWSPLVDESLDEKHDAEIFRAVVESMKQWELHKSQRHRTKREVSKVCYEDIGCFEDTGPFSYLEMLPSPPKDVGTRFLVYGSRKARSIPMEVPAERINENAHRAIDPELPTKVIVHGFGSSCDHVWVYEMRSALMAVHECNIVCVDWGPGSAVPNYVRAAANTRLVARQLAKLIRSLNVPLEKVHLIGFSLGAHVAGFAGAELGNVSRITGLDPAGPLFESQDPRARLDETDANFVDVIHSNGEQLILGGLGSWQPMGDVDFYPNGGRMQTGCSNLFLGAVSDIIWSSAVEGRSLCNHRRAYKLFTDSVSPKCRFPAFPCDHGYDGLLRGDCFPCGVNGNGRPCGDMGYYSNESPARGQLYLVTRDEEPFCAHQYQVKVYNSRSERPARSYGKLQVTIVGEGSFNETFAMTRKDEELLVGAILQKIVVPHPTITNLEAIEIKYTAYSGWISSGLVSWSIDKVAIVDSFGKTLSVCMRGLILESGRAVRLPLYPGECNIPADTENSTYTAEHPPEHTIKEKSVGIGPFTKDQNYETKDHYSVEVFSNERTSNQKGLGPFTKEENLRVLGNKDYKIVEDTENRRGVSNPWAYADLANDGGSNSLENTESERGRGFSGSIVIQRTTPKSIVDESTTEDLGEIREPVLQVTKKETGRSMKLPEITEPILRPRATRQNAKGTGNYGEKRQDEIQETSPTSSRVFTIQFLPERLAGILAQAEKYARQTLLPLISQYTPSFIVGARQEEPKYFPPLGPIVDESSSDSTEIPQSEDDQLNVQGTPTNTKNDLKEISPSTEGIQHTENQNPVNSEVSIVEAIYSEQSSKESENNTISITERQDPSTSNKESTWVPLTGETSDAQKRASSRKEWNASRSLNRAQEDQTWIKEGGYSWSPRVGNVVPDIETKIDDWVPVTVRETDSVSPTEMENFADDLHPTETEPVSPEAKEEDKPRSDTATFGENFEGSLEKPTPQIEDDRKYIPLLDYKDFEFSTSAPAKDLDETTSSTERIASHIQKIPKPTAMSAVRRLAMRTMVFPYAYERIKDPRTRYIPLIPEEDVGRSRLSLERLR